MDYNKHLNTDTRSLIMCWYLTNFPLMMLINVFTMNLGIAHICIIIFLYVDDMLIRGNSLEVVYETKRSFPRSKFEMKSFGELELSLEIMINRSNELKLSKKHYIKKILRKFEYFDCNFVSYVKRFISYLWLSVYPQGTNGLYSIMIKDEYILLMNTCISLIGDVDHYKTLNGLPIREWMGGLLLIRTQVGPPEFS